MRTAISVSIVIVILITITVYLIVRNDVLRLVYWDGLPVLDLAVDGQYAYVLMADTLHLDIEPSFLVMDISDPSEPLAISEILELKGFGRDIELFGNYAYILLSDTFFVKGRNGLLIVDIADPTHPITSDFWPLAESKKITVANDHAFVINHPQEDQERHLDPNQITILDVADPTSVKSVGIYQKEKIRDVVAQGELLFVLNDEGLTILDISDPITLKEVGFYKMEYGTTLTVQDDLAFMTSGRFITDGTLNILEVNDPDRITSIGSYRTSGRAWEVAVDERYAYVADAEEGLTVFDISDPEHTYIVDNERKYWILDLAVVDRYIYGRGDAERSFVIYELANNR